MRVSRVILRIIWTDDLPKTRSGKIMRRLPPRDIAEGHTLRNHDVVDGLSGAIAARADEA